MPKLVPITAEEPAEKTSRLVPLAGNSNSAPKASRLVPINGADLDDVTFVPGDTEKGYAQWKQWRQGQETSDFTASKALDILRGMVSEFGSGVSKAAQLAAAGEGKRLVNSIGEGVIRGSADLGLVVNKASDKARRALTVDEEEALSRDEFRRWRNIRKLEAMREKARTGEEDLVDFLSLPGNLATDDVDIDPQVAEAASYVADIATVAAPPLSAGVKASKIGPKIAAVGGRAAEAAGRITRNASEKAVEKFPNATKAATAVSATIGGIKGGVGGALVGGAAIPAAKKVIEKTEKLEPFGAGLTKAIEDLPELPTNMGPLERVSKNRSIPDNIRAEAAKLSSLDPALRAAGDLARTSGTGAAIGAGIGAASGESGEEVFAGAVGGAVSGASGGALHQAANAISGRTNAARMQGSVNDFLENHRGDNDTLLKLDPSDLNNAATAYEVLKGKVDLKVLNSESYAMTAGGQAEKGAAAFYDPKTKTITIDGAAKGAGQSMLHEVGEAIWDSGIVDKPTISYELKNLYGDLGTFKRSYAEKLLTGKQSGRAIKKPTAKEIDAKVKELDATSDHDWVVREMFSEGFMAETYGKDLRGYLSGPLARPLVEARSSVMDVLARLSGKEGINSLGYAYNIFDGKLKPNSKMSKAYKKYARDLNQMYSDTLSADNVIRIPRKKSHPALGITDGSSDLFNIDGDKVSSKKIGDIKAVFKNRAKDVQATIPDGIIGDEDPRVGQKYGFNNDGSVNLNKVEIRGSVLPEEILALNSMQALRGRAEKLQQAIDEGQILRSWYQGVGTGDNWVKSVIRNKGNLPARDKRYLPIGWLVTKQGNINVKAVDLDYTAARAKKWQDQGKLKLWGNDVDSFLSDAKRLLKNHAEGIPGKTGFSDEKFNILNTFFQGNNKSINPAYSSWDSQSGKRIYEDLRLERIASIDTASPDGTPFGMGPFSHTKIKRMLSPSRGEETQAPATNELIKQRDLNNRGGATYTTQQGHRAVQPSSRSNVRVYSKEGRRIGPLFKSVEEAQAWLDKQS